MTANWWKSEKPAYLVTLLIALLAWTAQKIYEHQIERESIVYWTEIETKKIAGIPHPTWRLNFQNRTQSAVATDLRIIVKLAKDILPKPEMSCSARSPFDISALTKAEADGGDHKKWHCDVDVLFPGEVIVFQAIFAESQEQTADFISFQFKPLHKRDDGKLDTDIKYPRILPKSNFTAVADDIDTVLVLILIIGIISLLAIIRRLS